MSKTKSLLSVAKTLQPVRRKCWRDLIPADQLKELDELKAAYVKGEFRHLSLRQLHAEVVVPSGIQLGLTRFSEWMQSR